MVLGTFSLLEITMNDREQEIARRLAIFNAEVAAGRYIERDDYEWATMTGPYADDRPPYHLVHSNVDGAGSLGSFWTLDAARAEADRRQDRADATGNPWCYRFTVYTGIDRAVYHTTSRPAILQLTPCAACGHPFRPRRPSETQCGPCHAAAFTDVARRP